MTELVYYVIRQRGGWGVQFDGRVRSGHPTREQAIEAARAQAEQHSGQGVPCRVRIQCDAGVWAEDRSFAQAE